MGEKMKMNGIWKVEMLGPYGWEPIATAFLEDGKYKSASENHFTIGSYVVSGNRIEISVTAVQHGKTRTVFGKKKREMALTFDGDIKREKIKGHVRENKTSHQIAFQMTRLADLS
jgi:hypothetical protein